ncbi:MAG: autotransporter outer membrane beta-barrel domain-containing protein, partial [Alphaproteobacteria bacterium]|nr:autotransporter outer membrane beta-barrel domain-containing protein [Alphaproteobacteria bacterium]
FEGRAGAGARFEGETRTGWLGADARSGRWVAGLAVSRGTSGTDYTLEGEQGRIETALNALWPYGRWTFRNGLELRGLAGAGSGTARHAPEGDAPHETSRLAMRAGSLGLRQAFAPLDGFDLAVRADASFARMETDRGEEAVDGLRADSWRLRGGLEASKPFALQDGATLKPFAELAARRDGGDGVAGSGVELAGGLRYAAAGVSVEARGRWLAAHSEKGVRERGLSATVRLDPEAGGRGLSLSLTPRWGAHAGGSGALWREEAPQASGVSDAGALDARLGWGFALAPGAGGLLTPFAEAGMAGGGDRRLRLGTRFEVRQGALALELAGERRETAAEQPEHAVRLELRIGF